MSAPASCSVLKPCQGEPGPPGRSVVPVLYVKSRLDGKVFRQGLDTIFHGLCKMNRSLLLGLSSLDEINLRGSLSLWPKQKIFVSNPKYTALVSHVLGISVMTREKMKKSPGS